MTYTYLTRNGVIVPDTEDLLTDVEAEYRRALGSDLVTLPESPAGRLIAAETDARDRVLRNNAELANQINPRLAGGVFLDAIAALTGLERRGAEPSRVRATLGGVPGTLIPERSRAATEAGDTFYSVEAVEIGDTGTVDVDFLSEEADAVGAPSGSLTRIVDLVLGWETITNAGPAVEGQATESDVIFRKRRADTLYLQGVALPGSILSAVRAVDGVRSALLRENYTSEPKVIDNVIIDPHSVYVVVDGGADEDVAYAMFANKSLGSGWTGTISVPAPCPVSGQVYDVRFNRPEPVAVRARLSVRVIGNVSVDVDQVVRQAIVDYADDKLDGLRGFQIGQAVSPFELSIAVGTVEPSIFVVSCLIGLFENGPDGLGPETLPIEIWQKATITAASIDVVRV